MAPDQLAQVDAGFSAKAAEYDGLARTHPVVIWMRDRIRALVESQLAPGGAILEINAGSGLDAAYFAARGFRVARHRRRRRHARGGAREGGSAGSRRAADCAKVGPLRTSPGSRARPTTSSSRTSAASTASTT